MVKWLLAISVLIYSFLRVFDWIGLSIPSIIRNYFADLLVLPVVLSLGLFLMRWWKTDSDLKLNNLQIIYIFLLFSLTFEWWLPRQNALYTADFMDVVMYAAGGVLYFFAQSKEGISSVNLSKQ